MLETPLADQYGEFPNARAGLLLRGPAGLLECAADVPDTDAEQPATIVICHPHPQFGGTMNNKVVTTLERSMRELGLRTVRFNFRGAGASEGEFDGGRGETDDLKAVAAWVGHTRPDDELWLGGFSFGSYVATRAAPVLGIGRLICIAPPVDKYPFDSLPHPGCPWLVVQGDEDELVSFSAVKAWASSLKPPPELLVMQHADHLFHRRIMDLRDLLKNAVLDQLSAAAIPR